MGRTPVIHCPKIRSRRVDFVKGMRTVKTSIYDNVQNIFELQSALRRLQTTNKSMPLINPDGLFGAETVAAVIAAQEFFGIPQTGAADYETWRLLFDNYFGI